QRAAGRVAPSGPAARPRRLPGARSPPPAGHLRADRGGPARRRSPGGAGRQQPAPVGAPDVLRLARATRGQRPAGLPHRRHRLHVRVTASQPTPRQVRTASMTETALDELIRTRAAHVAVIGQGYVGLPLAVEFARAGFTVTGFDADLDRVVALNLGRSCTPDVTNEELAALLKDGGYEATVDGGVLERSDVVIICVPTPLRKSKDPDISAVVAAAETTAARVHRGQLVV